MGRARGTVSVRRSPHLVFYWKQHQLIARNYATGAAAVVSPLICHVLHCCKDWTTAEELAGALPFLTASKLRSTLRRLVSRTFLEQSGRARDPREHSMEVLAAWNPEAGLFHTATKNVRFWPPQEAARRARARARESPMPPAVKRYRDTPVVELPPPGGGEFGRVARQRRTWRRFSEAPVTLQELATLLGLSVGVQKWVRIGNRDLPLKTSPSGGARHPVEAYVVAHRVQGLRRGIYHYNAARHAIERIGPVPALGRIKSYMPHSGHFAAAPALVFFTAVLERQIWRYPYSRAYRAAFIETGHVAQTFCLAATALDLAPFCLMGLADALIERDLKLDGIARTRALCRGGRPTPARHDLGSPSPGDLARAPQPPSRLSPGGGGH